MVLVGLGGPASRAWPVRLVGTAGLVGLVGLVEPVWLVGLIELASRAGGASTARRSRRDSVGGANILEKKAKKKARRRQ